MKRKYHLIALDIDGTVLNDSKEIDMETKDAIHTALASGVEVVFCTGRSYAEMRELLREFPDMHYLSGESGALLFDLRAQKVVRKTGVSLETAKVLLEITKEKDIMPCIFSDGECIVDTKHVDRMEHFHMGQYQQLYKKAATTYDNALEYLIEQKRSMEKINFYHAELKEREKTYQKIKEKNLLAEVIYSEYSSLECTAKGLTKAKGLEDLSDLLQIPLEYMAMVGDADNDLAAMKAAGLAIAMGNAGQNVKNICDMVVADNNHQGCAQAVRYLCQR